MARPRTVHPQSPSAGKGLAGGRGGLAARTASFVASRYRICVEQGVFDWLADGIRIEWDDPEVTRWMPSLQKHVDNVQDG